MVGVGEDFLEEKVFILIFQVFEEELELGKEGKGREGFLFFGGYGKIGKV